MFDKELMKQLATIPAENRAEWFAERDKLHALAAEMNRLNADEMVIKYGVARVIRVLAATIKCCPDEYDPSAVRMANWVPPIRSGRNAEEWFHSTMHRAYVQSLFLKYAELRIMEEVKSRRHTMTDAEAETHCDALQVYDNGAWHPVVAFSHGYMGPAADYTVAGVKMFKEV